MEYLIDYRCVLWNNSWFYLAFFHRSPVKGSIEPSTDARAANTACLKDENTAANANTACVQAACANTASTNVACTTAACSTATNDVAAPNPETDDPAESVFAYLGVFPFTFSASTDRGWTNKNRFFHCLPFFDLRLSSAQTQAERTKCFKRIFP